jgi:hypothetical protein
MRSRRARFVRLLVVLGLLGSHVPNLQASARPSWDPSEPAFPQQALVPSAAHFRLPLITFPRIKALSGLIAGAALAGHAVSWGWPDLASQLQHPIWLMDAISALGVLVPANRSVTTPIKCLPGDVARQFAAANRALSERNIQLPPGVFAAMEKADEIVVKALSQENLTDRREVWHWHRTSMILLAEFFAALGKGGEAEPRLIGTMADVKSEFLDVQFDSSLGPVRGRFRFRYRNGVPNLRVDFTLRNDPHRRIDQIRIGADTIETEAHVVPHLDIHDREASEVSWAHHIPLYADGKMNLEEQRTDLANRLQRLNEFMMRLPPPERVPPRPVFRPSETPAAAKEAPAPAEAVKPPVEDGSVSVADEASVSTPLIVKSLSGPDRKRLEKLLAVAVNINGSKFTAISSKDLENLLRHEKPETKEILKVFRALHWSEKQAEAAREALIAFRVSRKDAKIPDLVKPAAMSMKQRSGRVIWFYALSRTKATMHSLYHLMQELKAGLQKPVLIYSSEAYQFQDFEEEAQRMRVSPRDLLEKAQFQRFLSERFLSQEELVQEKFLTTKSYSLGNLQIAQERGAAGLMLTASELLRVIRLFKLEALIEPANYQVWRLIMMSGIREGESNEAYHRGDFSAALEHRREAARLWYQADEKRAILLSHLVSSLTKEGKDVINMTDVGSEGLKVFSAHVGAPVEERPYDAPPYWQQMLVEASDPALSKEEVDVRLRKSFIGNLFVSFFKFVKAANQDERSRWITELWERGEKTSLPDFSADPMGPWRHTLRLAVADYGARRGIDDAEVTSTSIAQRLDVETVRRYGYAMSTQEVPQNVEDVVLLTLRWLREELRESPEFLSFEEREALALNEVTQSAEPGHPALLASN